jgi:hypothetical protein
MLMNDTSLIIKVSVQTRLLGYCPDHRTHQEWQDRKPRLLIPLILVESRAELLKVCDVDFFDIGDVRDVLVGERHLLGNAAAQTDELDVLHGCFRLQAR